jgi:hypothetical protein
MKPSGYISLDRAISEHWISDDPEFFRAWVFLIMEANFATGKKVEGGKITIVKKGELLTNERQLENRLKLGRKKLRRFLTILENDGMILLEKTRKGTKLKVANYQAYQSKNGIEGTTEEPQRNHKRTTEEPKENHEGTTEEPQRNRKGASNNKDNNKKKINKRKNSDEFSALTSDVLVAWSEICSGLPQPRKWTPARNSKLIARIREDPARQSLVFWQEFFKTISQSPFLSGENNRGWTADLPWVLNSNDKIIEIMEGKYAPRQTAVNPEQTKQKFEAEFLQLVQGGLR